METQVVSVSCNHCGAPLEVPQGTHFVTCQHCGAKLQIHVSGGAAYTELLESIDGRTKQIAEDVAVLKRQGELERLDREWANERANYLVHDKKGNASLPGAAGSLIGAIIAGVFGVIWTTAAASSGAPWFFCLFGVVFVAAAVASGVNGMVKAGQYEQARRRYEFRRWRAMDSAGEKRSGEKRSGVDLL
jgi:DNA-directed RNA polymerase subunit RPC12/RpoP